MKRVCAFTSALLVLPMLVTDNIQAAEPLPVATAPEAVANLFAALAANDVDKAIRLTAPVEGVPAEAVREYYRRSTPLARKPSIRQVVAHLQLSDTAVVVFREGGEGKDTIDLDPAYLVQRNGKWLVLFKLANFDRSELQLNEKELADFRRLQIWFASQKTAIRTLLRDEKE